MNFLWQLLMVIANVTLNLYPVDRFRIKVVDGHHFYSFLQFVQKRSHILSVNSSKVDCVLGNTWVSGLLKEIFFSQNSSFTSQPIYYISTNRNRSVKFIISASLANFRWSSSAQSMLVSDPVGTHDHIFALSKTLYVLKWGLLLDKRRNMTTIGHSPSTEGYSSGHSFIKWSFPPRTSDLNTVANRNKNWL
jgi:hypothetical protein